MKKVKDFNWEKTGLFAAGVAFGTAGIKLLTSEDAKKFYTHATAAVLRAKSCVMKTIIRAQENVEDIYEGAKDINAERLAEEQWYDYDDLCDIYESECCCNLSEEDEEVDSEEEEK